MSGKEDSEISNENDTHLEHPAYIGYVVHMLIHVQVIPSRLPQKNDEFFVTLALTI
jgi:hypothetical protein